MSLKTSLAIVLAFCAGGLAHAVVSHAQGPVRVADALTAAPQEYHLEFENEFARVTRIRYAAHGKAPLHSHSAPGGVIITLTDQDARVTGPDGSTRELHYKAGQARWAAATPGKDRSTFSAHEEENLGDGPFELIRVDPKIAACR
jgi:hypothetical protein